MSLFHFTCRDHGEAGIRAAGIIRPAPIVIPPDRVTGLSVVWLTDLPDPRREQVGLTSRFLQCDRTEIRFDVDCDAERWRFFARFGDPYHWFVTTEPVPVATEGAA